MPGGVCLLFPTWPIVTIDFEASSLEQDGYPIEAGLAVWLAPDQPVLSWSTLIRPTWEWTSNGHWSVASAKVHGIRGADLVAHGREPSVIAAALNSVVGAGAIAWCDGGPYDANWLAALFKAGKVTPAFTLGDWDRLVDACGSLMTPNCARSRAFLRIEIHRENVQRVQSP